MHTAMSLINHYVLTAAQNKSQILILFYETKQFHMYERFC